MVRGRVRGLLYLTFALITLTTSVVIGWGGRSGDTSSSPSWQVRRHGRSPHARNRRPNCQPSASWVRARLRLGRSGQALLCSDFTNSAGSRAARF